jgi:predicted AlkP superfamily phosphohydrolase/phosphomutase
MRWAIILVLAILELVAAPAPAAAYIGPGAGIAFLSSFLVLFSTIIVAVGAVFMWPLRFVWRLVRRRKLPRAMVGRLIIVGFDGQDPRLTDEFMEQGHLPNFARLAAMGCYRRLQTTYPAVSPVAWSSFSTGTNPARHNVFDFVDRDRRTYLPLLSSVRVGRVDRVFRIGRYLIPRHRAELHNLRKSIPFWTILGRHGIWSTILRMPVTFPPDRFYGAELSAMSVPDLLGTQGTFQFFTTRPVDAASRQGGLRIAVEVIGDRIDTAIEGPENLFVVGHPLLRVPMTILIDRSANRVRVMVNDNTIALEPGTISDWQKLSFHAAPGVRISGIARFHVVEMDEHFSLYLSPINLDPEKPVMPISHPSYYASYLAKRIGPYSTLGMAEDTWALNEGVINESTFLQQAYDIDDERRSMFFAALDRLRHGSLVCVFDATDRIQHMFWRYLDAGHPAAHARQDSQHQHAIRDLYKRNDELLGDILGQLKRDDVLMVISDHGFSSFRRGVNLNAWLHREGYLALERGRDGTAEWLRGIDWSRTKAYCFGLAGMFLNVRGRERSGVVEPGQEADALKAEIVMKLNGLVDPDTGDVAIREAFDTARVYSGPYLENGPELSIGYNAGYRTSWEAATGVVAGPIFTDNVKPWSGDHCIDPRLVPGVFFCNRRIDAEHPTLIDIAPTALRLFGIQPPTYMDGRAFQVALT